MQADWIGPGLNPPNANVPAPINVSSEFQEKIGHFSANILAATYQMRSNRYCNGDGTICVTSLQSRVSASCPVGQAIRAINANGSVTCQSTLATTAPAQTCTTESTTVSGCYYGSGNPSCPAGWIASGPPYQGSSCSTNNDMWYKTCIRTVCS